VGDLADLWATEGLCIAAGDNRKANEGGKKIHLPPFYRDERGRVKPPPIVFSMAGT